MSDFNPEAWGAFIRQEAIRQQATEQPSPHRCKHECERDNLKDRIDALEAALRGASNCLYNLRNLHDLGPHDDTVRRVILESDAALK